MVFNALNHLGQKSFKELQKVNIWGGNIALNSIPEDDIKRVIIEVSEGLVQNCFGYFVYPTDSEPYYHISRYPRRKYGEFPEDRQLFDMQSWIQIRTGTNSVEKVNQNDCRFSIAIGLEEGYGTGIYHDINEVREILGEDFTITQSKIFTVRPQQGGDTTKIYEEPSVLVRGDDILKVFQLAEIFKQERFAVEDFKYSEAYMIETPLCTESDIED